jgi:hypothetical protein
MAEEEDDSETGFSSSNAGELAWSFIDVEDRRGRWDHGEQWRRVELHVMNEAKLGNDLPAADSVRADAIPGGPWQSADDRSDITFFCPRSPRRSFKDGFTYCNQG